ncbi:MAG: 16S rRNA (guanine(966)-N(2))-methyltransferase RsmD [Polyangia bacterium]
MLRIIAGELGGRRLRAPAGLSTRPTADRVRQALFNILPPPPEGAAALDLYAGSGALGIEALSRGCERAVFVDQDPKALQTLHTNLADLGLRERGATLALPVLRAVQRLARDRATSGGPFAWVFADPPYAAAARGELGELLELLGAHHEALLTPDAIVVIEHAARDAELPVLRAPHGALSRTSVRRYGDTALSFFTSTPLTPEPQRLDDPSGAS